MLGGFRLAVKICISCGVVGYNGLSVIIFVVLFFIVVFIPVAKISNAVGDAGFGFEAYIID